MDTPPQPEATGRDHAPVSMSEVSDQRERPPLADRGELGLIPAPDDPDTRVDWAQCRIAARISAEHSGWDAGHDLFGWYAVRVDDGHTVRASGPSGLKTLIGVAPPFSTWHAIAELRRAYPAWHIWRDGSGWHARRRGNFRQDYRPGAPLYAVHGADATELRGLLDEQATER